MSRIDRIVREHSPEEHFVIRDTVYLVIRQSARNEEYAIKVFEKDGESRWLKRPESRFETLGGARLAILMDLEPKSKGEK